MERKGRKLRLEGFKELFRRDYDGSLWTWAGKDEEDTLREWRFWKR